VASPSDSIIKQVIQANDIVQIIGQVVDLKPSGSGRSKALCPFHQEKTPSFFVNHDRQFFHCFGCGKHGDVLTFVQLYEGCTFREALETLAARAGIVLPATWNRTERTEYSRQTLYQLVRAASDQYRAWLKDPRVGHAAREYLKKRNLGEAVCERFGLGYAPDAWTALYDVFRKKGYTETLLRDSGLFASSTSSRDAARMYDAFRNRLMFPIRSITGEVVAFGGRLLGEGTPKYINSPDTAIYKKGRTWYGLYEARNALRTRQRAIIVEGYVDVLRCFEVGIENVVAPCGTAVTPEQAQALSRLVTEVIVAFDGDEAGLAAVLRNAQTLLAQGLTVRAVALPDGLDPDEFIQRDGGDAFLRLLDAAEDIFPFYIRARRHTLTTPEAVTRLTRELFEIWHRLDPEGGEEWRIGAFAKQVAELLSLSEDQLWRAYFKFRKGQPVRLGVQTQPTPPKLSREDLQFVALLLNNDGLREKALTSCEQIELPPSPLSMVLRALKDSADVYEMRAALDKHENALALLSAALVLPAEELPPPEKQGIFVEQRVNALKREVYERRFRDPNTNMVERRQLLERIRALKC